MIGCARRAAPAPKASAAKLTLTTDSTAVSVRHPDYCRMEQRNIAGTVRGVPIRGFRCTAVGMCSDSLITIGDHFGISLARVPRYNAVHEC